MVNRVSSETFINFSVQRWNLRRFRPDDNCCHEQYDTKTKVETMIERHTGTRSVSRKDLEDSTLSTHTPNQDEFKTTKMKSVPEVSRVKEEHRQEYFMGIGSYGGRWVANKFYMCVLQFFSVENQRTVHHFVKPFSFYTVLDTGNR